MKSSVFVAVFALMLLVVSIKADCDDNAKNPDDGEVTTFFKNLGCKISEGANKLSESAKPLADKISSSAKDFGNTVANKYDEIKHKLTEDSDSSEVKASTPIYNAPTEKVPLAPLGGQQDGGLNAPNAAQPTDFIARPDA